MTYEEEHRLRLAAEDELARLREEVGTLNRAVARQEVEKVRLREENSDLASVVKALEDVPAERDRLREENDRLKSMDLHSSCHKREDRLRKNYDAAVGEAEAQAAEVDRLAFILNECQKEQDRLREENDALKRRYRLFAEAEILKLREELMAQTNRAVAMNDENARLREELEDATEMLAWAYQWVDPHKHVAVDIAEFLRARNAPKETTDG